MTQPSAAACFLSPDEVCRKDRYDSNTTGYTPGDWDTVAYSLGEFVGRKVQVTVTVNPWGNDHAHLYGLLWGELNLSPLIDSLPDGGEPIQPDVLLTSLASLAVEAEGKDTLKSLLAQPSPTLWFYRMKSGFAMPPDVKAISCEVDPRWRRFVACIGPSSRCHGTTGPFQVWLDDQLLWQSGRFSRLSKAQQIDVRLPVGRGKRLTLRVAGGRQGPVTWGDAGFMLE